MRNAKFSKRTWIGLISVLITAAAAVEWLIPQILLHATAPVAAVQTSTEKELAYFPNEYVESRDRFLAYVPKLKNSWRDVKQQSHAIDEKAGLYIDVIQADANSSKENLVLLTSGVHGIEGYVGSAMMEALVREFLPKLNQDNTGIMLVHAVNPWGMQHKRRYNEHNVDLNRNFISDWKTFDRHSNQSYEQLAQFMQPDNEVGNIALHETGFYTRLLYNVTAEGSSTLKTALVSGQYTHPQGVYYGGSQDEPSTVFMKQTFHEIMKSGYKNIVHVDLHTGYGPRYQMSIFTSASETMTEAEATAAFNYPLVLTPSSKDFYATSGDMTEYFYQLQTKQFPDKKLYSTTFEFGTLGTDLLGSIQSLKYTIDENRLYWNGSSSAATEQIIKNRSLSMFYPSEEHWRLKAVADFRQALTGLLKNRNVIQ